MRGSDMMDAEIAEMRIVEERETDVVEYDLTAGIATISCSRHVEVWRTNQEGDLLEQIF